MMHSSSFERLKTYPSEFYSIKSFTKFLVHDFSKYLYSTYVVRVCILCQGCMLNRVQSTGGPPVTRIFEPAQNRQC